jgi:hypothetical protein
MTESSVVAVQTIKQREIGFKRGPAASCANLRSRRRATTTTPVPPNSSA